MAHPLAAPRASDERYVAELLVILAHAHAMLDQRGVPRPPRRPS